MSASRQIKNDSFFALSRRKSCVVKVLLIPNGSGKINILTGNSKNYRKRSAMDYFNDKFVVDNILTPLILFQAQDRYDINAHVSGGGQIAQACAIKHAVSKALLQENFSLKPQLKSCKLLTQDTRKKERKKVGKYGARRSPQFTKR